MAITRRTFLQSSALATFMSTAGLSFAQGYVSNLGSQSYSFRTFSTADAIANLKALGLSQMEFCGAHFPADASHADFETVKALIAESGITVPCYGVEGFGEDHAANEKKFEFAKALGCSILTADPTKESFPSLNKLVDKYGIKIAIHNHGPNARYDKVSDTLTAVDGQSPLIGACLDTGHCIRSEEKPHLVAGELGDRLISMHLKDWNFGGEEQIVGEGEMKLKKLAKQLKENSFTGPIMLEFELDSDGPVPGMKKGLENWAKASS